jgi:hypothetical protein
MVRNVKDHFRKSFGRAVLNFDQLQTALIEIECAVNMRPLVYVSEGVDEPHAITPFLLITGRRSAVSPTAPPPRIDENISDRDALIRHDEARQTVVTSWWKSWQKDYLRELTRFHAKGRDGRPIEVGELVVIHDANAKRLLWVTGVVVKLFHGRDGKVRAANVRVPNGTILNRAIQCLYPIEVKQSSANEPDAAVINEQPPARRLGAAAEDLPNDEQPIPDDIPSTTAFFSPPEHVGNIQQPESRPRRQRKLPRKLLD